MMTGRERVRAALTFSKPDRAPRDLWALPYVSLFRQDELDAVLEAYPMDIQGCQRSPGQPDASLVTAQVGSYKDEWGSVWHLAEPGMIGEVKEPALADWAALASFQPPWELIRGRDLSHVNRQVDESDRFVLSEVTARPFERLQFLRGTQNLFIDIAYGVAEVRTLLEMVHEYYLEDIRGWCQTQVDGVVFMDDWGTSQALLINPDTWRAMFKPLYKDYCDLIHAAGKFAFFHTDGNTTAIYGDLIEVGIDAINSQLFVMDIEALARQYKGKVTFWGEIDRQHVLPFGTPEEVRAAVMRVRRALDDGSGGVIAQCEWGKDNPRRNIEAVFEAWLEPLP
ncbi:MAG: uroporphyrinogen decarboxylase family protein [Anaerolineae bacterium]